MTQDLINRPIIVTGCARSGTSLVAGILHHCGAWVGDVTGPMPHNRKGQFENEHIRDRLTKPYLKSIGCDHMGQDPLPPVNHQPTVEAIGSWQRAVLATIKAQGYKGEGQWLFKGAKAALIWRLWHQAFPQARWVVVNRDAEKIVDSCMRTRFMHKRKTREAWMEWVEHHRRCFTAMAEEIPIVYSIWPGQMAYGEWYDMQVLVQALGLTWDEDKVREFVDHRLWSGG